MAKYSFEFKKMVVEEYLEGKGSTRELARRHNIGNCNHKQVSEWVASYNELGDDGLLRSRQNKKYSFEFKMHVVELYMSGEDSYRELALSLGVSTAAMVSQWVNAFRTAGPDALRPKEKGRKKSLNTREEEMAVARSVDGTQADINTDRVKQLEDELLKLRIENAYLKELRRLRLEEEALLKKQRELSTTSEESSN